ncbi:MAG: DNRLRE domain-containing protein, partial [Chloroflexi bacterium]|nr:DNRLRE domain-containing protein [Chloroflexota bacterium]
MHSRRVRTLLSILFGFAFLWLMGVSWVYPASAGGSEVTVTLTPVADAYVDEQQPNVNFGAQTELIVRNELPGSGPTRSYALLRFDLNVLPADISVLSATLHLTQKAGAGDALVSISALRSLGPWDENSVTWSTFPAAGGPVSVLHNIADAPQTEHVWDVTALVAAWVQGTYENHGFVLGMDPAADAARAFWSRESERNAPYLEIVYAPNATSPTSTPTPTNTPT